MHTGVGNRQAVYLKGVLEGSNTGVGNRVPEGGVGGLKQSFVAEQGGAGGGAVIVGVGGDVFGGWPSKYLQPLEEHLFPALQGLKHSVAQGRAYREV